jgi:hypothetical protein
MDIIIKLWDKNVSYSQDEALSQLCTQHSYTPHNVKKLTASIQWNTLCAVNGKVLVSREADCTAIHRITCEMP